jgi:hypothetical protein
MSYPIDHMVGINDLFPPEDDYSWIKGEGNLSKQYVASDKRSLAKQVFHTFMKRALEDIVENGNSLKLPAYEASILIEEVPEEVVAKKRKE